MLLIEIAPKAIKWQLKAAMKQKQMAHSWDTRELTRKKKKIEKQTIAGFDANGYTIAQLSIMIKQKKQQNQKQFMNKEIICMTIIKKKNNQKIEVIDTSVAYDYNC